ncbi:hypothetical protein TNCT_171441 [Trichonephila clavata]|uniref:Uncharacterized protein n=1 Tax=Trichonephila clavata TaxID=2740835 RepID=A0A8X6GH18_TRICU|nr:hypothetical protein TNCT_171441 [Trichonephila clavata]
MSRTSTEETNWSVVNCSQRSVYLGCVGNLCARTHDLVTAAYVGGRRVSVGFTDIGARAFLTSSCTIYSSNWVWG